MEEPNIKDILKEFSHLPKFPDGRINYTNSNKAPVLIIFIKYKDKILLLKRSKNVSTYKNLWSTVAGFIDEQKSLKQKVLEELKEEINITNKEIKNIKFAKPYEYKDKKINKTWLRYPVLVELKEVPKIKLDFEHTEFKWLKPQAITKYKTAPGLNKSLKLVIN